LQLLEGEDISALLAEGEATAEDSKENRLMKL
jgi:hypothetical protein